MLKIEKYNFPKKKFLKIYYKYYKVKKIAINF